MNKYYFLIMHFTRALSYLFEINISSAAECHRKFEVISMHAKTYLHYIKRKMRFPWLSHFPVVFFFKEY